MLTQSKEQIAMNAYTAALRVMNSHSSMGYNNYNQSPNSIMGQLTNLIALAVQAGVEEALKGIYTNEEFEQDIGLDR